MSGLGFDVAASTWMRWEGGRHSIPADAVPLIAKIFGVTISWLYGERVLEAAAA